jgi:hypothetical protein
MQWMKYFQRSKLNIGTAWRSVFQQIRRRVTPSGPKPAPQNKMETEKMTKLTSLINRAASSNTVYYAAQKGIFFDSMDDMIAKLNADGFSTQQNDGKRVLVGFKVWMTRHGVVTPVNWSNL